MVVITGNSWVGNVGKTAGVSLAGDAELGPAFAMMMSSASFFGGGGAALEDLAKVKDDVGADTDSGWSSSSAGGPNENLPLLDAALV